MVGVISGRRMDNRVEGERGWGAAAEGIFEVSHATEYRSAKTTLMIYA